MPDSPAADDAVADALHAAVLGRHGHRLDDEQAALVRERIGLIRAAVAALDAVPLANADEPDFAFGAPDADR